MQRRTLLPLGMLTVTLFPDLLLSADDSYQVGAEALRAIGRTGDRSQIPFLEEALSSPSPETSSGRPWSGRSARSRAADEARLDGERAVMMLAFGAGEEWLHRGCL